MSNLLERAIIDAKALKEAALKNAEQLVIEKYSVEVKEAMNQILEDETADAMDDLFGGDEAGQEIPESPTEEEVEGEEPTITNSDIEAQIPDAFASDDEQIIKIMT